MYQKRRSLRLSGYDYAQNGFYFVTVCIKDKRNLFGRIENDAMNLNNFGHIVENVWKQLSSHYSNCRLDQSIIMPNHMHGIIEINNVGAGSPGPLMKGGETPLLRIGSLSDIMGYFKYQSTKQINVMCNCPGHKIWQRGFHDRIIRNEKELNSMREYIQNNPKQWELDKENLK